MYNVSVAREFLKQVYVAERLQPPTSTSTLTSAYSALWSRASNPAYWREIVRSGEWAKVGVYAVEAYGIFKVSCGVTSVSSSPLTVSFPCSPASDWRNCGTKEPGGIQS